MAFTGTPTVALLGRHVARITGISLAAGASGTITGSAGAGDAKLPSTFWTNTTEGLSTCRVTVAETGAPAAGTPTFRVVKSGSPVDTITITNNDGANNNTGLEVFVENIHSLVR